jgi:hypothetical protein
MNCIKFPSVLASKKAHFQIFILGFTISMFFTSCGGGSVPEYLREARVDVSIWTPKKEVVLKKDGLNLVKAIVPLKDSTEFLIVSDKQVCWLLNNKLNPDFKKLNPELWNLAILRNTSGEPSYIIGNGGWGKPSAAVLDINGQLKWKKDYGYDAMGMAAILDDGDERFVVLEKKDQGLLFLSFESGEIVRKDTLNKLRILASADFTGDGHQEILVGLAEDDFAIMDGKQHELSKLSVSDAYWYEPVVTSSTLPFVVLSAGNVLDVYDSKLKFVKKLDAEGAASPMHVVAATFFGEGPSAPFAAIYNGRGGWHRSILFVFSSTGELVYKEILGDDYQSITPMPQGDRMAFLLGGRDEVFLYSFKQ